MLQSLLVYFPFILAFFVFIGFTFAWYLRSRKKRIGRDKGIRPDYPATRYKTIAGNKMAYWDVGSGPPIVLLHGIGASKYIWRKILPHLNQKGYRVIAVDLVGFGESDEAEHPDFQLDPQTDYLHQFLTSFRFNSYTLIGSSMGGSLAIWYAKKFPEVVKSLVLLAPAVESKRVPRAIRRLHHLLKPLSAQLASRTMALFVRLVCANPSVVQSQVIMEYLRPFQQNQLTWKAFGESLLLLADRRLDPAMSPPSSPALILYGAKDRLVRWSAMTTLAKSFGSPLIQHQMAGHHLMEDEPDWTALQILDFVRRLDHP